MPATTMIAINAIPPTVEPAIMGVESWVLEDEAGVLVDGGGEVCVVVRDAVELAAESPH
jgi:hypothetical protein